MFQVRVQRMGRISYTGTRKVLPCTCEINTGSVLTGIALRMNCALRPVQRATWLLSSQSLRHVAALTTSAALPVSRRWFHATCPFFAPHYRSFATYIIALYSSFQLYQWVPALDHNNN